MNIEDYIKEHGLIPRSYCNKDGKTYILCDEENDKFHTGDSTMILKVEGDDIESETALGAVINWNLSLNQDWAPFSKME